MAIFMDYEGIKGDVQAAGFENKIELNSFQWGVGRGISSAANSAADREATTPSVSEITITKVQDVASADLLRAALFGEGKTVKIVFTKTDKDQQEPFLEYELTNTLVSGFSSSSGGDRPMESLSLNFTKIQVNAITMKDANDTGDPDRVMWDLALNKGS